MDATGQSVELHARDDIERSSARISYEAIKRRAPVFSPANALVKVLASYFQAAGLRIGVQRMNLGFDVLLNSGNSAVERSTLPGVPPLLPEPSPTHASVYLAGHYATRGDTESTIDEG